MGHSREWPIFFYVKFILYIGLYGKDTGADNLYLQC